MLTIGKREQEKGAIVAIVVVGLMALLGMAALTVDVGLLALAAQQAQDVADAAALGAGSEVPDYASARAVALSLIDANNESSISLQAECAPDAGDIVFWTPFETIAGYGSLGSTAWGTRVTVHVPVEYVFAPVLGLKGATVTRSCTVVRMPTGAPVVPMWMSYEPPLDPILDYGAEREMLMASSGDAADIPGSFGWLAPPSGDPSEFSDLLCGYGLTPDQLEANQVAKDDILTAYTGLSVGNWKTALDTASDGLARLQRATDPQGQWANDTFENFHTDNPRIVIVPMVEYLGESGSGARFVVKDFAAFWIESINSQNPPYSITGRFIKYRLPGMGDDALSSKLFAVRMVK